MQVHDLRIELREAQSALLSLSAERNRLKDLEAKAESKITELSELHERTLMEAEERESRMVSEHNTLADRLRAEIGSANDLIGNLQVGSAPFCTRKSKAKARTSFVKGQWNRFDRTRLSRALQSSRACPPASQARVKKLEGQLSEAKARGDNLDSENNIKSGRIAELEKKSEVGPRHE